LVFPEAGLWWWAYVGLVPVLALVRAAPNRREALVRSWAAGCGFFLGLHHWLVPTLLVFTPVLALLVGLVWVPWGAGAWWLLRGDISLRRMAAAVVVLPSIWVMTEYVRAWHPFGGSWGFLGLSQWQVRPILAVAALGGVWALSFLLASTNVAVSVALMSHARRWVRAAAAGLTVVLIVAALVYGLTRPSPEVVGHLRIGGVQPGVVHSPRERLAANERITDELVTADVTKDVDIVVWGQSSVGIDIDIAEDIRQRLLAVADRAQRPVIVNVDGRLPHGRVSKTTMLVRPDGLADTYTKQRLVPFGEYIPLRPIFGWLAGFTKAAEEDRLPGTDFTTFELAGATIGPLISYESTFPDIRRTLARRGVDMTLVQAAATTFQGSWALPQQASFEAVRAVESGRPAVLVAVSGTSAAFDPRGRQLTWIDQDRTGAWTVDVPLSREDTPFVRWGDWVPAVSLSVLTLATAVALRDAMRARRHRRQR
jgi:apolipoprotein N-acyltransferase